MQIAILSDIHANREAFEACLAAASSAGAGRFVLLGDIVGYGADPEWCTIKAMELVESGAIAVRGNHDHAVSDPGVSMNANALLGVEWARLQLSETSKRFLAALPMQASDEDRLYVHADASAPARWNYVMDSEDARYHFTASSERVSFCGHVHRPALYCLSEAGKLTAFKPNSTIGIPLLQQRRWLAVIGSVGQPRDGNSAAAFGLYETDTRELRFMRAAYDVATAAAKIREAGLPEALASRLMAGR